MSERAIPVRCVQLGSEQKDRRDTAGGLLGVFNLRGKKSAADDRGKGQEPICCAIRRSVPVPFDICQPAMSECPRDYLTAA